MSNESRPNVIRFKQVAIAPVRHRRLQAAKPWLMKGLLLAAALACGPLALWSTEGERGFLGVVIGGLMLLLLLQSPRIGISFAFLYLAVLGGMRRWLTPALGWTPTDPLLLVCPVVAGAHWVNMLLTRRKPPGGQLGRLLPWLLLLMFCEVFNPLQGGISIGLAGMLFCIVPLLWYYVGRCLGSPALLRQFYNVLIVTAILAALYGLYQMAFGFPTVEQEWFKRVNYTALHVGKALRPFSFFTSSAEYTQCMSAAITVLWAMFLRGTRLALVPIPLLAAAVFLGGDRGPVVLTLLACTLIWAVQGRNAVAWMPRVLLAVVLASGGLVWSLRQVQDSSFGGRVQDLAQHQTEGLLDPTNSKGSTLQTHSDMIREGILDGFRVPIGRGLGAANIAGEKFGATGGSSEFDVANMFIALGFSGGLLFVAIIFVTFRMTLLTWRATRSLETLILLGILVSGLGNWLNGGHYAMSMLVWVGVGATERFAAAARTAAGRNATAEPADCGELGSRPATRTPPLPQGLS